mmetsp:Transcript_21235/g.45356  ORF Transcript_21235/g.45356 Transcript_21235/m.45356 type:complete len:470 (-) Transcript_21235:1516-2925(-)
MKSHLHLQNLCVILAKPTYDAPYFSLLVSAEAILTTLVVLRVPYTEIDWVAYMQEVTTYQDGERDYVNIRGGTGPLVYPAGFLYLYSWFKSLAIIGSGSAESGIDSLGLDGSVSAQAIQRIQWLFVLLYLFNSVVVLALYQKVLQRVRHQRQKMQQSSTMMVWYWRIAMGLTCLSKRVHSIFVLRLFNDAPAMILLHLSMYLFACCDAWALGCMVFSLAVSIKMNVLLFAPGLLLLLLQKNRSIFGTMQHLSICALVQLVLGWPFLSTYPMSYIKKAFEFDRVFFYKWTVNWKFLPEELFVCNTWAMVLLTCHLGSLGYLATKWWNASTSQRGGTKTREWMCWKKGATDNLRLSPEYIIYTMFASNFIGIAFARTLHYQFYCWYFYSLPMLHWMITLCPESAESLTRTSFRLAASAVAIFGVEYGFNVFPATEKSSLILQFSHAFLLIKIFITALPLIVVERCEEKKSL